MSNTSWRPWVAFLILLAFAVGPAAAFGAGNIASISKVEGKNFRHGDIEDILKTLLFLKAGKWTSKQVKRVYFGNWLRDYSQALDVGTLKGAPAGTIRILVAVLGFLSFGFATEEFEVTDQRLGVYRPEEHIDNPKNYADNLDARAYDSRLRPPVMPVELAVDPATGMKNYIANEQGGWATSAGYVKYSLDRSIHFGRLYTSGGPGLRGKSEDLCEALRCLGQALHTMEDFSAHSNYCELVLRELGFDAFPHVGKATEITLNGRRVFPLVTGTFGSTDFLHSVLGEAQDKLTQNELEELDLAMAEAEAEDKKRSSSSSRGFGGSGGSNSDGEILSALLSQLPGTQGLGEECSRLQADSDAQSFANMSLGSGTRAAYGGPPSGPQGAPGQQGGGGGIGGAISAYNPEALMQRVWPILQFRDRVFRAIEAAIEKVPGLVDVVEKISELLSVFIFSLLAPILRPVIEQVALELKKGSSGVLNSSADTQFEPWTDPHCTDPTHSLLSKDHFSNRLNEPCGHIAQAVVKYVVPRIVFAWENPNTPSQMVLDDVIRIFHHPATRDPKLELHANMFKAVQDWVNRLPDRGSRLNAALCSEGVRTGKNHVDGVIGGGHEGGHGKVKGSDLDKAQGRVKKKKSSGGSSDPFSQIAGAIGGQPLQNILGSLLGGAAGAGVASEYSGKPGKKDKYSRDYDDYDRYEKKSDKKDKYDRYDKYDDYDKRERDSRKAKDYDYDKSEKKHKSKEKKEKVKDEEYYRRKAERKARKERERAEGYGDRDKERHKHKSRDVGDDDDDDDSDDSDDSRGGYKSPSKHKGYDDPYKSSRAVEQEAYPAQQGYQQSHDPYAGGYSYQAQQPAATGYYGGETRGQEQYPGSPGGYGQQQYGGMPGAFPGDPGYHSAPYPTGNAQPYNTGSGYVIGSDGTVGRERDYEYDYSSGRDLNYPDESVYGAPPPTQDFGYISGGHGSYSGSGGHTHGYGSGY
ncbi:hypothetical protein AA313_de0205294 [Arthrobotrys entomopaga]|nr:hypothetical protein AA313_de0205294 [Arthrobotrys entomopaga]